MNLRRSRSGDKAYDLDALDAQLAAEYGIKMIAPNRRRRSKTQDGRLLRRYRRKWETEWLLHGCTTSPAWSPRCERHAENFLGFVQLGCLKRLLRCL